MVHSCDGPHATAALRAVADACRVADVVQGRLAEVREIVKDDRSPVTVADFAVQAIVSLALRDQDPLARIVGEERADVLRGDAGGPGDAVKRAVVDAVRTVRPAADTGEILDAIDRCDHDATGSAYWALDPIDGTKGFLRGQQYAVALGLIERGAVTFGVMGCPNLPAAPGRPLDEADATGVMYAAARGSGAWEVDPSDPARPGRRLEAAVVGTRPIRMCESVEAAHSRKTDTARIAEALGGVGDPARLDSQCKYALVARGEVDAYLRIPTRKGYVERIWDHAAGSLIATEAGAVVSDITGSALDFSRGVGLERNRGVVCAAADLHPRVIEAIRRLGIGSGDA